MVCSTLWVSRRARPHAACRRAWEGLKPTEVLRRVASNVRLQFPPQTPHRLKVCGRSDERGSRQPGCSHLQGLKARRASVKTEERKPRYAPPTVPQILGERCMEYSPSARPTMDEVLSGEGLLAASSLMTMGVLPCCW